MVICLEQCADLHMAQLMPLPLIVSCFSKIQIDFTFLVPAHLGSPGQRAVKRVCVCVSVCVSASSVWDTRIGKLLCSIKCLIIGSLFNTNQCVINELMDAQTDGQNCYICIMLCTDDTYRTTSNTHDVTILLTSK